MALPIHLFRPFCCRVYHLATTHFTTDRQTDIQTDDSTMPIDGHIACSRTIG